MRLIKAGVQDWGIDSGPAPFRVTNVTFSGVMPGGHASASFEVPVANAYITQHHTLKEGVWISIWDDGHELFEGEILSIKPSVASGVHKCCRSPLIFFVPGSGPRSSHQLKRGVPWFRVE